jgi:hypothetical protein
MASVKSTAESVLASAIARTIEEARAPGSDARSVSERFDRARFEAALEKMDAVADSSDTDEAWESIISGIRSARASEGT